MGQAKRRGDREARRATAIARVEALKPKEQPCEHCGALLTEFETLNVRNTPGIEGIFTAVCGTCDHRAMIFAGDPATIALAMEFWRRELGGDVYAGEVPDLGTRKPGI